MVLGYVSALAYLKSRASQIYKNCVRGDADGLSISMFMCAIAGNGFGALGILLRVTTLDAFVQQLPWLIGMVGTIAMDMFIAWQALRSARRQASRGRRTSAPQGPAEDAIEGPNVPLLPPD